MFVLLLNTAFAATPSQPVVAAPVPEVYRFVAAQRRLELGLRTGDLSVRSDASVSAIEVRVSAPTACSVDWETGGRIDIRDCAADVQVVAPFGTTYQLAVGTGDVRLQTSGRVRLSVGTGDVSGSARGPVRVAVGTGNVQLDGLTEEPTVAVASGKTELSYAATPGS